MSEEKTVSSVSAQENIKSSIASVKTLLSKIAARNPKPSYDSGAYGGYGRQTAYGGYYNGGYKGLSTDTNEDDLDEQFKTSFQKPEDKVFSKKPEPKEEVFSGEKPVLVHRKKDKYVSYIYTPAGDCPVRPEGFKSIAWESGPASEEVIQRWCVRVYNAAPERFIYHPHAITYFAQFYWQKEDLKRVKKIILDLFDPERDVEEDDYV